MKMQLQFDGSWSSLIGDLKERRIYHYEEMREWVHENFGGEAYYTSRSELSGAGWIPAKPYLVNIGWYRTDACTEWRGPCHEGYHFMAPVVSHEGFDEKRPIAVVNDGGTHEYVLQFYHICGHEEVTFPVELMFEESSWEKKTVIRKIPQYAGGGEDIEIRIDVYGHRLGMGLNYMRFIDVDYLIDRSMYLEAMTWDSPSLVHEWLSIERSDSGSWVKRDVLGLPLGFYEEDPLFNEVAFADAFRMGQEQFISPGVIYTGEELITVAKMDDEYVWNRKTISPFNFYRRS